eukprot:253841-Prymnesium_polylepis.1
MNFSSPCDCRATSQSTRNSHRMHSCHGTRQPSRGSERVAAGGAAAAGGDLHSMAEEHGSEWRYGQPG